MQSASSGSDREAAEDPQMGVREPFRGMLGEGKGVWSPEKAPCLGRFIPPRNATQQITTQGLRKDSGMRQTLFLRESRFPCPQGSHVLHLHLK